MTSSPAIVNPLNPARDPAEASQPSERAGEIGRLTEALARGDEEAFQTFFDRYFARLLRYLIVITRDEESARDALQETLRRMVRHVRRFDDEQAFWDWLVVVARSAARDGARKGRRYRSLLERFLKHARIENDVRHGNGGFAREQGELLTRAVNSLPEDQRHLIQQKYWNGRSVRELATDLSLSEKAVESRLLRARRRLREIIQNHRPS